MVSVGLGVADSVRRVSLMWRELVGVVDGIDRADGDRGSSGSCRCGNCTCSTPPQPDEIVWAREVAGSDEHLLALLTAGSSTSTCMNCDPWHAGSPH